MARIFVKNNIDESNILWINALDRDGNEYDNEKYLSFNHIIALGNKAESWILSKNKKCIKVPHPSYWMRYRAKEEYPLLKILKTLEV